MAGVFKVPVGKAAGPALVVPGKAALRPDGIDVADDVGVQVGRFDFGFPAGDFDTVSVIKFYTLFNFI